MSIHGIFEATWAQSQNYFDIMLNMNAQHQTRLRVKAKRQGLVFQQRSQQGKKFVSATFVHPRAIRVVVGLVCAKLVPHRSMPPRN